MLKTILFTALAALAVLLLKPFEANNIAEFALRPEGDMTHVTWSMHGPANFMSKLMQVFSLMDKMVGQDFADGLANLKAIAEAR